TVRPARDLPAHRRVLLPFSLRGIAVLDRFGSGSERYGPGGRHDVEDVRYDGVAHRIRAGAGADYRGDEQAAESLDIESDVDRAEGCRRGDARVAGLGSADAGRVSPAPGLRDRTLARHSGRALR